MSSKPRTREHFPKMKQRGRYRAYRAPRTNLFPGLARASEALASIATAAYLARLQVNALMREALVLEARRKIAFTQEMYAREDERRARERTEIADSINRWAGHPEQTIRGAQASVVLIDETPLLQDVAVRRPWWKFWAR